MKKVTRKTRRGYVNLVREFDLTYGRWNMLG